MSKTLIEWYVDREKKAHIGSPKNKETFLQLLAEEPEKILAAIRANTEGDILRAMASKEVEGIQNVYDEDYLAKMVLEAFQKEFLLTNQKS